MANKPTPARSTIQRNRQLAFSRRQRTDGGEAGAADKPVSEATPTGAFVAPAKPVEAEAEPSNTDEQAVPQERSEPETWPPPRSGEPWPTSEPPAIPVERKRAQADTMVMPPDLGVGEPPEVPPLRPMDAGSETTVLPGPRDIPAGEPGDPAAPPGRVPSGDSRSLRRGGEFALVYRVQTCVISRFGAVGTRGQWRVVEYPTAAAAGNAYARECSRFVAEGFLDYRD